jgi:hypothetical protein
MDPTRTKINKHIEQYSASVVHDSIKRKQIERLYLDFLEQSIFF